MALVWSLLITPFTVYSCRNCRKFISIAVLETSLILVFFGNCLCCYVDICVQVNLATKSKMIKCFLVIICSALRQDTVTLLLTVQQNFQAIFVQLNVQPFIRRDQITLREHLQKEAVETVSKNCMLKKLLLCKSCKMAGIHTMETGLKRKSRK